MSEWLTEERMNEIANNRFDPIERDDEFKLFNMARAALKYRTAIDAIYNESDAGRELVIKFLGVWHP
jgi:hypothetical protein